MLSVQHITKSFGSLKVLDDVSLELNKGEILSLAGESGCGKSTLLRIIAGLEKTDAGKVALEERDISNWSPEKRRFGFVFQNHSLFPHLSVEKNVFFGLSRKEHSQQRLRELLDMVGMSGLEKRYPHELSGGQQQRVAIARALAINPELLILDEPFSSLDELLKAKIRDEIFGLLRDLKITILMVSHQANDSFLIADKLMIMKDGKLIQSGSPSDIYSSPSSEYVSDFFGASVIIEGKKEANQIITPFGKLNLHTESPLSNLLIRPENIEVSSSNDFSLSGKITQKLFKGPHDVLSIQSLTSPSKLNFETERTSLAVGDTIYLKIPSEKIIVLD